MYATHILCISLLSHSIHLGDSFRSGTKAFPALVKVTE